MSIPDDTPAAVTIRAEGWGTTRSPVVPAHSGASSSIAAQWVVAVRSVSRPAVPRMSEPVHTDVVHWVRSEEHTSELQSRENLVCRLLLEKKKKKKTNSKKIKKNKKKKNTKHK